MKKSLSALSLAACLVCGGGLAPLAQTAPPPQGQAPAQTGVTANGVIGEVVAVDAAQRTMFVRTDAGAVVIVAASDATQIFRIPPGETKLDNRVAMKLAEIAAGDRVFARGAVSADGKTVMARAVIVNTKAELEAKQERDRAEWKARGVVGVVSAVNPETKEITISTRTPEGSKPVVIAAGGEAVKFRRYAPDSVKFSDAKPGTLADIKAGDQLRAKGEKSADGARFTPEEVVTGSFRTIIGTVAAVNAETKEVQIKTMQGGQTLTVVVSRDTTLKRIPEEFGRMMGGGGPGGPGGAPGGGGGQRVVVQQGAPPAGGAPAAAGQRVTRGFDPQEMLERLPAATVAELKPGQMVILSTTGTGADKVTAIQLVAGIEPLMAMMQARPGGPARGGNNLGNLNLGFGIGSP